MKKIFFVIACFCVLKANAQTYLVSFAGTGASTTVSSVKVENLTAGTSLTLNGSDILRLNITTGINSIEYNQSSELKIYPNPMTDNSKLEISPPVAGSATISVYDMTGKLVAQTQNYLENSMQVYRLSGIRDGFYFINVRGDNYQISGKLVSNGKSDGTVSIDKVNVITPAVNKKTEKADSKGIQGTVDMAYITGDRLKFTGISGSYSTVKTDIPASDKTITFNFIACTDGDNNNYSIVEIGSQIWMEENLKTTRYSDGTPIPLVTDNTAWAALSTPGYCWFNNDEATYKAAGALYNWYGVDEASDGSENVCPTGWHVPTDAEWTTLTSFVGGENLENEAGCELKETGITHWSSPNEGATNETGFTALPGGARGGSNGNFDGGTGNSYSFGSTGVWWSSTEVGTNDAWHRELYSWASGVSSSNGPKKNGFSVRCVKD